MYRVDYLPIQNAKTKPVQEHVPVKEGTPVLTRKAEGGCTIIWLGKGSRGLDANTDASSER